jgi:hypothetical protein
MLEEAIRPWIGEVSTPKVLTRVAPPQVTPPAYVRWGDESSFGTGFRDVASSFPGFHVEDKPKPTLHGRYVEEARKWTDFSIHNPEDDAQSVIIRRIDEVAFRAVPESVFADDKRGEQVTFSFSSNFEAHGEKYLKNSAGANFEAIALDPFTSIMEVGWGGDFAILVMTWEPAVTGLGNSGATFPQLFLVAPSSVGGVSGDDISALGINSGDPSSMYPHDATGPADQWMANIMEGSWPGEDTSAHGTSSRFVNLIAFYVNLALLRSSLFDELHDHGDPYFQLGWKYGGATVPGDQQGSPIARLGYTVYSSSAKSGLADFNPNVNAAVLAMSLASRTQESVMDVALSILGDAKVDSVSSSAMTDNINALAPTDTFFGNHYTFDDNYPNILEPY